MMKKARRKFILAALTIALIVVPNAILMFRGDMRFHGVLVALGLIFGIALFRDYRITVRQTEHERVLPPEDQQ